MPTQKNKYKQDIVRAEKFVMWFCIISVAISALFLFSCKKHESKYEVVVGEAYIDESEDLQEALDSCLADIRKKCKGVIDYALSLEQENARLQYSFQGYF